jgi:hypothetical protein
MNIVMKAGSLARYWYPQSANNHHLAFSYVSSHTVSGSIGRQALHAGPVERLFDRLSRASFILSFRVNLSFRVTNLR